MHRAQCRCPRTLARSPSATPRRCGERQTSAASAAVPVRERRNSGGITQNAGSSTAAAGRQGGPPGDRGGEGDGGKGGAEGGGGGALLARRLGGGVALLARLDCSPHAVVLEVPGEERRRRSACRCRGLARGPAGRHRSGRQAVALVCDPAACRRSDAAHRERIDLRPERSDVDGAVPRGRLFATDGGRLLRRLPCLLAVRLHTAGRGRVGCSRAGARATAASASHTSGCAFGGRGCGGERGGGAGGGTCRGTGGGGAVREAGGGATAGGRRGGGRDEGGRGGL